MTPRSHFAVFGIPVTVDTWMLAGLLLLFTAAGGGRRGVLAAVAIAVFTLIHELGHALTARSFGAKHVSIRLAFLVGWASYSPTRALARWQRNVISLAGPLVEIAVGVAALGVLRLAVDDPFVMYTTDRQSWALYSDLHWSIAFAGIVIGALNLLPIYPLDGGHVVESLLCASTQTHRHFLRWSIAVSIVIIGLDIGFTQGSGPAGWAARRVAQSAVESFPDALWQLAPAGPAFGMASIFIGAFCLINAGSAFAAGGTASSRAGGRGAVTVRQAGSPVDRRGLGVAAVRDAARIAESAGWSSGVPGPFPKSYGPSPWLEAALARRSGATTDVVRSHLAGLDDPKRKWVIDRLDRAEIADLVELVAPNASINPAVLSARAVHGSVENLTAVALELHRRTGSADPFYVVAEGLAMRGDLDEAMNWLTGAVEREPDAARLKHSRQLRPLHGRSDFQRLLGAAERSAYRALD